MEKSQEIQSWERVERGIEIMQMVTASALND